MATPSVAQFRQVYPEFGTTSLNGASDDLIMQYLGLAAELCDATVYGTQHTQAVLAEAADQLARSPYARAMQLVAKDGSTQYEKKAERMRAIAACGKRSF